MNDEYAVADGPAILYKTAGFRADAVTEKVPLSEGKTLLICAPDREILLHRLQEAENAIAAKDIFLSNMSHDIRTPMNAITGLTMLAKMHLDETERVSDALNKIETAGTHLLSLINDVLDMSRINSGRMTITPEYFALNDLIHEIMIIIRPQAEKKKHRLLLTTGDIPEETLYGGVLRLRQIYVNILSNAVKYTDEGGEISVDFSEELQGDRCLLSFVCRDNGMGMSEAFLERVFEPFERVETSTVSRIEGTGLGMSIVKKLTEAMDGTVDVQSKVGEGTTVTIRIPLQYRREALRSEGLQGKNLLILEADPALRRSYERWLEELGIRFTLTASAEETLNALADADFTQQRFDAAIIGRECGEKSGKLEIAGYLHKAAPSLPILLISDDNWDEIGYLAQHCGIVSFIPLPLFRRSLVNGLAEALEEAGGSESSFGYPDLTGKRILLVEDNMINQEIAKELIGMTGADTDLAENGAEAVKMFAASDPGAYSMILMDIQMPVMNGYDASAAIRSSGRPDAGSVPIYAMTANTFAEDIAKARDAGMNGHIAKPIDINVLMQVLGQIRNK